MKSAPRQILLFLALLPAACSAFEGEASLGILLPAPPGHWQQAFPSLGAAIVFPDATGRLRETAVSDWGNQRGDRGADAPVGISCPKAGTTPVLAWPRTGRGGEQGQGANPRNTAAWRGPLRPAGGFYPLSLGDDGRTLQLSWADGAPAYVLLLLRSGGMDCSQFNARRLSAYLGRNADPWDLDLEGIAQKIARGDFTAYDIDPLPAHDQPLWPGPGEWFLESPFQGVLAADQEGAILLRGLSDGVHVLFSVQGGELRLSASSLGVLVSPLR